MAYGAPVNLYMIGRPYSPSKDVCNMDSKRFTKALGSAPLPVLERIAGQVREAAHEIDLIMPPRLALAMIRAQETVEGRAFNLGEILISECTASVDGCLGYGALVGDRPVEVEAIALIDAIMHDSAGMAASEASRSERWEQVRNAVLEAVKAAEAARAATEAADRAIIERTRVEFAAM